MKCVTAEGGAGKDLEDCDELINLIYEKQMFLIISLYIQLQNI